MNLIPRNSWLTLVAGAIIASGPSLQAQTRAHSAAEFSTVTSREKIVQVRYPNSLLVCQNLDGENPDAWSPEGCASEIPVCDSSGHAGKVLLCLAYPGSSLRGSDLQAAAFAVSRIDNFGAADCVQKWARTNTSEIHPEKIGALKFQSARAEESAHGHTADQHIYRIYHKACYELDINLVTALDSAFAVEDAPRKLTGAEREHIQNTLKQALAGFRFLR